MGEDGAPAGAGRRRLARPGRRAGGSSPWLTAGAPVAISLLSLLLSVYTIVEANREPEVWLSAPPGGGSPQAFAWDEQGTWRYDPGSRGLTWIYLADPAPLVVGPSSPQLPTALFEGPPGWRWRAGEYRVEILAGRGEDPGALRATFAMRLSEAEVALVGADSRNWVAVRTAPA